ncbi:toll/interleukin-1 receptor domain-containing protein [Streptomyces sp. NPDC096057]|uniref:toll/interleukin-1 receptor domain-containing protein n=1 Tax=Streptomyces sp. NPDC096057 TaxID=3155543 RepID=UPI00331C0267
MAKIFINYRTGDEKWGPELVDGQLVDVFGEGNVFRDRRAMRPGTDFPDRIRQEVESCVVFLSLIGPGWLDIRDADSGLRRIDMPKDYVHDEIATALALNKVVIPVLLDASLPAARQLPPALVGLSNRQFQPLREGYTHHDMRVLINEIREYVPAKKPEPQHGTETASAVASHAHVVRSAVGINPVYNENAAPRDWDGNGRRPA